MTSLQKPRQPPSHICVEWGITIVKQFSQKAFRRHLFCFSQAIQTTLYRACVYKKWSYVALCLFFTQKRDCSLYKKMFSELKNSAEEIGCLFNPLSIVTDFELSAINAYKFHWPGAELKGCFFHYSQAIIRWAFKNGYKLHYWTNSYFNHWLKMIISLRSDLA